uniref:contractile injection system protein, VgrG/Pvc8 family n=1 Tax=Gilliamella sp. G0441 TaxID=3384760 RepID=UPI003D3473C0
MAKTLTKNFSQVGEGLINGLTDITSHNRYTLTVDELDSPISVFSVEGQEQLSQLWHYTITFTSIDKSLSVESFLNKSASFSFNPIANNALSIAIRELGEFLPENEPRKIYGIITHFSQLSVNKDEAHYQVVLTPRLARLGLNRNNAIFQNQNVVSVIEEVLRSHEFSGVDYRLELKEQYPLRE